MLLLNESCQIERVISLLLGSHNQCLTIIIGHTDILQSSIEGDGRHTEHTVGICQYTIGKDIGGMAIEVITDTLMTQHHALRTTCGARSINKVCKVIGGNLSTRNIRSTRRLR